MVQIVAIKVPDCEFAVLTSRHDNAAVEHLEAVDWSLHISFFKRDNLRAACVASVDPPSFELLVQAS